MRNEQPERAVKILAVIAVFGAIAAIGHLAPRPVLASAKGPFPGFSGAPGEETCRHCHDTFPINQFGGLLTIGGFPEFYTPGETYTVTVTLESALALRWGFQATSLTANRKPAGKLIATDKEMTKVVEGIFFPDRRYIEQKNAGTFTNQRDSATWQFDWRAPKKNKGPVTLHVSGNASNGDGDKTGDFIYYAQAIAQPSGG